MTDFPGDYVPCKKSFNVVFNITHQDVYFIYIERRQFCKTVDGP